jgi:hypothetical protein
MKYKSLYNAGAIIGGLSIAAFSSQFNSTHIYSTESWQPVILGFFLMVITLTYTHAHSDAQKALRKKDKIKRVILRGLVIAVLSGIITWFNPLPWLAFFLWGASLFAVVDKIRRGHDD